MEIRGLDYDATRTLEWANLAFSQQRSRIRECKTDSDRPAMAFSRFTCTPDGWDTIPGTADGSDLCDSPDRAREE